eukprot:COSAG01_NODE_3468_length_6048_cov_100.676357_7_plen_510_part_00
MNCLAAVHSPTMEFRAVGGVDLELSGSKADAYTQIAEYYKSEGRLGSKIVTYGATKNDVGISYMSGVRLCSERLSTHGWPAAVTELWLQYLHHVKPPLKKDDWIMTCHLVSTMEADGWEDIAPEDVVEFLAEDEATGGSFRTIHYDWLKYMQSGAAELFLYLGSTPWQASGDPAHPDFEPVQEDMGPGPGAIVGAQMEEKGENPFLSRQDSVYLPCGHVQVYFPNAEPGDIEAQARQKADVKEFKRLQARMETAAAQVLKKRIMQQRIRLAHRYTTILIHYRPRQGMYKGGLFKFLFRLPQKYPIQAPLCHCLTPIWHPNIIHDADEQPREQNVCCSYLHDSSFADKQEEGYIPGMSLWKVVWAICLLLHRFDEEGLGIFTVSNPLNKEAADQFLNNEDGFIEKVCPRCNSPFKVLQRRCMSICVKRSNVVVYAGQGVHDAICHGKVPREAHALVSLLPRCFSHYGRRKAGEHFFYRQATTADHPTAGGERNRARTYRAPKQSTGGHGM